MKKKILAVLLTLLMLLGALAMTTAADGGNVAEVNGTQYATLQEAVDAANPGETVTLLADTSEDVVINKSITLDLGGNTLTNKSAGKATISVTGGTVTVKNGAVQGGTKYYNIEVKKDSNADLTLEGVTATAGNTDSSMIDNWGTMTITSGTYTGGLDVVKSEEGSTLNIHGGKFTLNYSTDGYTGVILNYGTATITNGEFIQNATSGGRWDHPQVVATGVMEGYSAITKITGGTFTNNMSGEGIFRGIGKGTSDNFEVSGGTYNKTVSDGYFAEGYFAMKNDDGTYDAAGPFAARVNSTAGYSTLAEAIAAAKAGDTVTLLTDVEVSEPITVNTAITLDLGGKTLTSTWAMQSNAAGAARYALVNNAKMKLTNGTFNVGQARGVGAYAGLTLSGITVTQELTGGHACVAFCKDGATYGIKSSTISGDYAVAIFANNAKVTISNNTELNGKTCGLYHNGSNYGLNLSVVKTTINGSLDGAIGNENDPSGVYISGSASHGTMQQASFTNCTIKGATAIEVKYTDLRLDKCVVEATVKTPSYDKNSNGMTALGFAVVSTDNSKAGETPAPAGTVTITGSGKYTGPVGLGSLESVKTEFEDFTDDTIKISGGTFDREVPEEYCADGYIPTKNADGTYGVKVSPPVEVWTGYSLNSSSSRVACYETLAEAIENLNGNKWILIAKDYTLSGGFTIPADVRVDVKGGATLTVAEGATLTVAADAKRLAVLTGGSIVNNGTIMVCGTSYSTGKVMIDGTLTGKLSVPEGYFLDNNGNNYFATENSKALYEVTYSDGSIVKSSGMPSLDGATKLTLLRHVADYAGSISGKVADGFIFDLGGYTLTGKATATTGSVLNISAPVTIQNGTIKFTGEKSDKIGALQINGADVTIAENVTIDGGKSYAIWPEGYGHTLTVNGTVTSNGDYAIAGFGDVSGGYIDDCSITVNAGAVISAPNGVAIYHPELGTVTINGGEITGHTGIEMCAGKLVVKDGTITSTGADDSNSDNVVLNGAAISILDRSYPGGSPSAEITGGTFTSATAPAIRAYHWEYPNATDWTDAGTKVNISGGTFSSIPDNMSTLCAAGYIAVQNADGTYTVMQDAPTTYAVAVADTEHGAVTVRPRYAERGQTVTVTVTPDDGYVLETLTVTDKNGNAVELTDKGSGKYTFKMPGRRVEIKATFMEDNSVLNFFVDVPNDAYYYEAVKWAVENGITQGRTETTFCPEDTCTRAEIVTFLWRAFGSPEVTSAVSYTDVDTDAYYAAAVAWAVENGITVGTSDTTFSPDDTCTRAQAVTFLCRAAGLPEAASALRFTDVAESDYFAGPVKWAVENGVTVGTSDTTFSPEDTCTRAQIVTFLFRLYAEK